VREFLGHLADWVTAEAMKMVEQNWSVYTREVPNMVAEIRGIRDGAVAAGAIQVTLDRLFALNLLSDILVLKMSGDTSHESLIQFLHARNFHDAERALQYVLRLHAGLSASSGDNTDKPVSATTLDEALRTGEPLGCNSVAVKDPRGVVSFCRDFQLPNGGVYQDTSCIIIRDARGAGSVLSFCGGAPGLVAGTTCMKFDGKRYLAVGINILRSALQKHGGAGAGLPAMGIMKKITEANDVWTTKQAAAAVRRAPRFSAWTYPVCSDGDAVALEAGASLNTMRPIAIVRYARSVIADEDCAAVLSSFLASGEIVFDGRDLDGGVAVRTLTYADPTWLPTVNDALFAAMRCGDTVPFDEHNIFDPHDFTAVAKLKKAGSSPGNNYFVPVRTCECLLVTSNDAVMPLMRLFQMASGPTEASEMTSRAVQWRYDRAVRFGKRLVGVASPSRSRLEEAASFLSPSHFMQTATRRGREQYWRSHIAAYPMQAVVEGNLNIVRAGPRRQNGELTECAFGHKAGTWRMAFAWVSCAGFC